MEEKFGCGMVVYSYSSVWSLETITPRQCKEQFQFVPDVGPRRLKIEVARAVLGPPAPDVLGPLAGGV